MYIVSSCLAGYECRYNSTSCTNEKVLELVRSGNALPLCPEQLGGLTTPRDSCEIVIDENGAEQVVNKNGDNFTASFLKGAQLTLSICKALNIKKAILQSRSPSCGKGIIYDGTFSGKLINGYGITAGLLQKNGVQVQNEIDFERFACKSQIFSE
ncbi:MAG: DUF523 domain-containing protein [Desulfobacter sp.]